MRWIALCICSAVVPAVKRTRFCLPFYRVEEDVIRGLELVGRHYNHNRVDAGGNNRRCNSAVEFLVWLVSIA